jgi:hypothetical protein
MVHKTAASHKDAAVPFFTLPMTQIADRLSSTMIYTHVLNKGPLGVVSPLDTL